MLNLAFFSPSLWLSPRKHCSRFLNLPIIWGRGGGSHFSPSVPLSLLHSSAQESWIMTNIILKSIKLIRVKTCKGLSHEMLYHCKWKCEVWMSEHYEIFSHWQLAAVNKISRDHQGGSCKLYLWVKYTKNSLVHWTNGLPMCSWSPPSSAKVPEVDVWESLGIHRCPFCVTHP